MSCSQPTYEELKLKQCFQATAYKFRSQPTYEELKPGRKEDMNDDEKGSQPTYEELKPHELTAAIAAAKGFSAYL